MDIDTNVIKLNLNKARVEENNERWIEQDIIVPDNMPDALKIININSVPYINDIEINKNKVKIVGKIGYNVIYLANEDKMPIRGLTISYPFTVEVDSKNINKKEDVDIEAKLKNNIYSLPNERKIAIKNEVEFKLVINTLTQVDIIKDFSKDADIESNKVEKCFSNVMCNKTCVITSSEDISISKDLSPMYEILKVCSKISDTDIKISYNKLMLKGELCLKVLYLGENNVAYVDNIKVPFSSMIELENITDKSKFNIRYYIRDLNVRIKPDIDQKTLSVDYKIEANIQMYEEENIEYVEDFYSRNRELKYDVNDISVVSQIDSVTKEIIISDVLSDVIEDKYKVIEYSLDTSNVPIILDGNNIKVSGVAKLNLLLQNKETQNIESKTLDIMVENSILIDEKYQGKYINAIIEDVVLNVMQNGTNIDFKIILKIKINVENVLSLNSINKIKDEPLDLKDISSINIYVVKPKDSIWKIAKKYKTSMSNIIKTNNLENPTQIEVGQKILVIR